MKRRRLSPEDYTVGWICALPIELAAAQEMLDEEHQDLTPADVNDSNVYTLGRIHAHNLVIVCLPAGQIGTNTASAVAAQMKSRFPALRFGLMVGIGGGVPNAAGDVDIRLGDVVISQPQHGHGGVVQYDLGKTAPDQFQLTGFLNQPPTVLLSALSKLKAAHIRGRSDFLKYVSSFSPRFARADTGPDILFRSDYIHIGGRTCERCSVEQQVERPPRDLPSVIHYGTIASGNQVMRDGSTRDSISRDLGEVLCFEMEAAGLMNSFPCLVIRGICDYADSHKNKGWQAYAAATASACAKELLSVIPEIPALSTPNTGGTIPPVSQEAPGPTTRNIDLEAFLKTLLDQDQGTDVSHVPLGSAEHIRYSWVFENIDFRTWKSSTGFQSLLLLAPSDMDLEKISSHVAAQEQLEGADQRHCVLHFPCSRGTGRDSWSTTAAFTHSFLLSIVRSLPSTEERVSIIKEFIQGLDAAMLRRKRAIEERLFESNGKEPPAEILEELRFLNERQSQIYAEQAPEKQIAEILDSPPFVLWAAVASVLTAEHDHGLTIILDGLDRAKNGRDEFIKGTQGLVTLLRRSTVNTTRVLLTSYLPSDVKEVMQNMPCIEYDRERRECLTTLQFENTRYHKISREHEGSFNWFWSHLHYRRWSTQQGSRLLYIQGKPGSGKSTLMRYINDSLMKQESAAESSIVGRFFYSYREGELQKSHYNMLLSILYDVLQQEGPLFYHCFQREYRLQAVARRMNGGRASGSDDNDRSRPFKWEYESLKTILSRVPDYQTPKRFYFIIDAVDESDDRDRNETLNLLFRLCSREANAVVKIIVASRPVGFLESRIDLCHNFIRLQDHTKSDISKFADSFLKHLKFSGFLEQAREYIVSNAQGVFLWVQLAKKELQEYNDEGRSERDVFQFLKSLPSELEDFYKLMLGRMGRKKVDLVDGIRMLRFVLFAKRPLTVDELLHATAVEDDLHAPFVADYEDFQRGVPQESRILHCGGNFLEVREHEGIRTVQVIHQTVREFFLQQDGHVSASAFKISPTEAHESITITLFRYLMLCNPTHTLARSPPDIASWSEQDYTNYVHSLDSQELLSYCLCYIGYHIGKREPNRTIYLRVQQEFLEQLKSCPAASLMEPWASLHLKIDNPSIVSHRNMPAELYRGRFLHAAVRSRAVIASGAILNAGVDVNAVDSQGHTVLLWAAQDGYEDGVKQLLEQRKINVNFKHQGSGRTALHWAAFSGCAKVVELLINTSDINPESADSYHNTPLLSATIQDHSSVVSLLLNSQKVAPDCKDSTNRTPLSWAAERGQENIVQLLLEHKVSVDDKDAYGRSPLTWAAMGGHANILKLLLKHVDDVYSLRVREALLAAAEGGHIDAVEEILECGASAHQSGDGDRTPLICAATGGHRQVMELLLTRYRVDPDKPDARGRTPLSSAAAAGNPDAVQLLIFHGARVDQQDNFRQTPLSRAAANGQEQVVRLLLSLPDVSVDSVDHDKRSPLSWAAAGGHAAVVSLLISRRNVELDSQDILKRTPLSWAAAGGHTTVVRLLLNHQSVQVNSKDRDHRTPLSWAAIGGHRDVIALLLPSGDTGVNLSDMHHRRTPLMWAAFGGHTDAVELLLASPNIEPDFADTDGRTALIWSASRGYEEIVRLLLDHRPRVNVNAKDRHGRTPLSWAAAGGHQSVVRLLVMDVNIEINLPDTNLQTPLSWAAAEGHAQTVRLLLNSRSIRVDLADRDMQTPLSRSKARSHGAVVKLINRYMDDRIQDNPQGQTPTSRYDTNGLKAGAIVSNLDSVPRDIFYRIVQGLDCHDFIHLSRVNKSIHSLMGNETIAQATIENHALYSQQGRLARDAQAGYRATIGHLYDIKEAWANAAPYATAILGSGREFLYNEGILCYIHRDEIRLLDVHKSATVEQVVNIPQALTSLFPGTPMKMPRPSLMSYACGILCFTVQFSGETWLIAMDVQLSALNPRHRRLRLMKPIPSALRLWVRHDACYLYYGTACDAGPRDFVKWTIICEPLVPGISVNSSPAELEGFVGADIGQTVCFEIHHHHLYAVTSQIAHPLEEEPSWWSSYYGYVILSPTSEPGATMKPRRMWRRWHREGTIFENWGEISLQVDEATGRLTILECRREWLSGKGESMRTYYIQPLPLPDEAPSSDSLGESDGDPKMRLPRHFHCEYGPGGHDAKKHYCRLTPRKYHTYNLSASAFVDLIDNQGSYRVGGQHDDHPMLLRTISRKRKSPIDEEGEEGEQAMLHKRYICEEGGYPMEYSEERFVSRGISTWPPEHCPAELQALLRPSPRATLVKAVADDRSLIYSMNQDGMDGEPPIVLISFDPKIRFPNLHRLDGTDRFKGPKSEDTEGSYVHDDITVTQDTAPERSIGSLEEQTVSSVVKNSPAQYLGIQRGYWLR